MSDEDLRSQILAAMDARKMSKADLSRRSGVPYHAMDKWLKGVSKTTSVAHAVALTNALGLSVDKDEDYDELKELFYSADEQDRETLLKIVRGYVQ